MKVFISWSGEVSHDVGLALYKYLPRFLQSLKPWISSLDIENGALWRDEINDKLAEYQVGIFCITRENLSSPWIHFEAGAMSKSLPGEKAAVIPFFFELRPSEITGPLNAFNGSSFHSGDQRNREVFQKMIFDLYAKLPERPDREVVEDAFNSSWDKLEQELSLISASSKEQTEMSDTERPSTEDTIELILSEVRNLSKVVHGLKTDRSTVRIKPRSNNWEDYMRKHPLGGGEAHYFDTVSEAEAFLEDRISKFNDQPEIANLQASLQALRNLDRHSQIPVDRLMLKRDPGEGWEIVTDSDL